MFLAVSGNIGAGKSTLVKRLAQHYGGRAELEAVDNNPYLNDFYEDMPRWAFPLQVYFLNQRFQQGLAVAQSGVAKSNTTVILDRTIDEDAEVFAYNLYELGHMSTRDYNNYRGLYDSMQSLLPSPDLIIYLQGSVPQLQQRIAQRYHEEHPMRQNEDQIPAAYLHQLNQRYEAWVDSLPPDKLVTISIDSVDMARAEAFAQLVATIDERLS